MISTAFILVLNYQGIFDKRVREAYERQAGVLGKTVADEKTMDRMADGLVHGSFQNSTIDGGYTTFSERIWVNQDALRSAVMTELTRGMIRELNPRELTRSLDKKIKAGRYNAERLMWTELARVQIGAQQQAVSDAGYDSYIFIATEGAHTCDVCRSLDGKKFKLRKMVVGENAPPMHPFCRCSVAGSMSDEEFEKLTVVDPVTDPAASDKAAEKKIRAESAGNAISRKRRLPLIDTNFVTYNNSKADSIRPKRIRKELDKSEVGRETLKYINENGVKINLCYNVDHKSNTLGNYDPIDDEISIYCDMTQNIKATFKVISHEVMHKRLQHSGFNLFQEEIICWEAEKKHDLNRKLTASEKDAIVKIVKKNYPELSSYWSDMQ